MKKKFKGLSDKESAKRLEQYGLNEISAGKKVSAINILLRQVKDNYIVYFLFSAAVLSFLVGKSITAYVILVVVLVLVLTGYIQEYKAEKAIEKLKGMIMPVSMVIRESREKEIPTKEIVPGDILILRTGERIPADSLVLTEKNLLVNEAILTGEADAIRKSSAKEADEASDKNRLFAGSFVIDGKCIAEVVATGMKTKFGKIAGLISTAEKELPLQKKVNLISKYMATIGLSMAVITGITGGSGVIEKLAAMGIRPGVKVRKVSNMRGGGPIVMICGRTQVALGRGMAAKIIVSEDAVNDNACKKPA